MEKVDIIDSNNNVIGIKTRKMAHKLGLLHRCVIAELKKGNEWTFVKQASQMQDAGQLASATGGHVRSGETASSALKREVYEELGIKKFSSNLKGSIIYKRSVGNSIENHYFRVYEIETKEKIKLNNESEEYQILTEEVLKSELRENPKKFGDALMFIFKNLYPQLLS